MSGHGGDRGARGGGGKPDRAVVRAVVEDTGFGLRAAVLEDDRLVEIRDQDEASGPGGRVTDAAGSDSANCRARVVTFTSNAAPARVLEWYRSRASQAGYSAEQQMRQGDHILAGTGGGGAYFLILTPRGSGSEVAIIANNRG